MRRLGSRSELTEAERLEVLRRVGAGERSKAVAQAVGCTRQTVARVMVRSAGLVPRPRTRSALRLSLAEREEISRSLGSGTSCRAIAVRLGRASATVSREVRGAGGRRRYRAWSADLAALRLARRPKQPKLLRLPRLRAVVERELARCWSPEQIAHRLVRDYPDDKEMRVSHETIYRSLYVQARGALRQELTRHLRTARTRRHPQRRQLSSHLRDMVPIAERPAEAKDRAVPGHWEGDLIIGRRHNSAIGTLVERRTRLTLLLALPQGHGAAEVRRALTRRIRTLPTQLRRTLTWDQGAEMGEHLRFSVDSGVQVYFCDPRSPWQRGSNENTNGLLRQYFPRGTDLSQHTQAELDRVARELNRRPRRTLDWKTPAEAFAEVVP